MSFKSDNTGQFLRAEQGNYTFAVSIFSNDVGEGSQEQSYDVVLDNKSIISFEYINELNKLCLTGTMTYVDKTDAISKFLQLRYAYISMVIQQYDEKVDGGIKVDVPNKDSKLSLMFLINGFEIIDRKHGEITYKIDLIGYNWVKCSQSLKYSNYNKTENESILDITKNILTQSELKVNANSFSDIKSSIFLKYTTHMNDTVFSSIDYLLNKSFYFNNMDDTMKFLVYDEHKDEFGLLDIGKSYTVGNNTYDVLISFFNNPMESMMNSSGISLAMIDKFPKKNTISNEFKWDIYSYSLDSNTFSSKEVVSDEIIGQQGKWNIPSNQKQRFGKFSFKNFLDNKLPHEYAGSYWNNKINIYNNWVDVYLKDSSLVVNVNANILLFPSCTVNIIVDRDTSNMKDQSQEQLNKVKNNYKDIEGPWYIGKIRHMIYPMANTYKQNCVLFRNFRAK